MTELITDPRPHLWRSSQSPAELIELAGGVEKNRGVLEKWKNECEAIEVSRRPERAGWSSTVDTWVNDCFNHDREWQVVKQDEACSLLRCLIPNPFAERVTCPRCDGRKTNGYEHYPPKLRDCFDCRATGTIPVPFREEWRTSTVVDLARMVRGNPLAFEIGTNKPIGWEIGKEPRFDLMPILADALMDAGCDDEDILEHCRGECHCDGCWVIEAILN